MRGAGGLIGRLMPWIIVAVQAGLIDWLLRRHGRLQLELARVRGALLQRAAQHQGRDGAPASAQPPAASAPGEPATTTALPSSPPDTLVLFYNDMWDMSVVPPGTPLPAGCRVTTDRARYREADAVVFHYPTLGALPAERPPGQLWVVWSMESDVNYPPLRDPAFMQQFDLTMTYRQDADVPLTYACFYEDAVRMVQSLRTPPPPKTATAPATLFISSGHNRSRRIDYATELMRHLDVHSFGRTLHNRDLSDDAGRASKLALIGRYHFNLAFENAVSTDYVTEKFYDPLVAGTVPVYLGAPNVEQFAPGDRCYINAAHFGTPRELAEYLLHLQQDEAAYAEYFVWKTRPFRTGFLGMVARDLEPSITRLCSAIQERRRLIPT